MVADPDDAKRALRVLLRAARGTGDAASLIARILALSLPDGAVVAGVWPLPGEPDLVPAWTALAKRGHPILLPETTERGQALRFRRWSPGAPMVSGRFGTLHPTGEAAVPQVVFVPLLAWDTSLARLGYGGGYYDRTLQALQGVRAIGFGFESQRLDRVPVGPYDVRLDAIVTESRVLAGEGVSL